MLMILGVLLVAAMLTGHGWLLFVAFPAAGAFRRRTRDTHPHQ